MARTTGTTPPAADAFGDQETATLTLAVGPSTLAQLTTAEIAATPGLDTDKGYTDFANLLASVKVNNATVTVLTAGGQFYYTTDNSDPSSAGNAARLLFDGTKAALELITKAEIQAVKFSATPSIQLQVRLSKRNS